jgi:hypothetical protein
MNLPQPTTPNNPAALSVSLQRGRELLLTPVPLRDETGYKLALRRHLDGGAIRYEGSFELATREMYELLIALQSLTAEVDRGGLPGE